MEASDFRGKVAVITGGASGIGLALALEAAKRGMKVAIADIGDQALAEATEKVSVAGGQVIAVRTDVAEVDQVRRLRDEVTKRLGDPWLVANNAGITKLAMSWDHSLSDWKRMLDINVMGVVNGLDVFLPGLRQRKSGYILNTASAAGLVTIPAASAYVASKHAVVGLSEVLYRELRATDSGVGVSVLCPALVKTGILGEKRDASGARTSAIDSPHALEPAEVAVQVFQAIRERQFWILTHAKQMEPYIRARAEQLIGQLNPDPTSIDPDAAATSTKITGVDFLR